MAFAYIRIDFPFWAVRLCKRIILNQYQTKIIKRYITVRLRL